LKDISAHAHPATTISENFPELGACFARLQPHHGKVVHAVSPARRPVRAAIFGRGGGGAR
jgi:hypothetical protein